MTTDEKMVTEREAVKRERDAFCEGRVDRMTTGQLSYEEAARRAAQRFPLPTVTRPREVEVLGEMCWLRVINGIPEYRRTPLVTWCALDTFGAPRLTVNAARVLVDLLANPTETVEDDA